jgi:hypothetical protein
VGRARRCAADRFSRRPRAFYRAPRRPLKPEVTLLLAAARLTLDPPARARLQQLIQSNLDWTFILELASRHRLVPLLYRNLDAVGGERVPRAEFMRLWQDSEQIARRNEQRVTELLRIVTTLEAEGIRAVAYKGPVLGYMLSGHAGLRDFEDLDFLLRRRDMRRAIEMLEGDGYISEVALSPASEAALMSARAQYHRALTHRDSGIKVELHWKTDPDFPVEADTDDWWSRVGSIEINGRPVPTFRRDELLLVLCLHGTKHQGYRLGWIVDVAELIRSSAAIDWPWMFETAARLGCRRRLAVSLLLAHDLLDAPLPADVLDGVRRVPMAQPIVAEISNQVASVDVQEPGSIPRLSMNLRLYDRLSDRLRHVTEVGFAPTLNEWSRWPLPRALYPLYVPLRLARLAGKYGPQIFQGRR